jgi:hypothetical protein
MLKYEIPLSQWPERLERFSRAHAGQLTRVTTSCPGIGEARNAEDIPLIGITAGDAAAMSEAVDDDLHVMLGGSAGSPHLDHLVERPCRLWAAEWNDGGSGLLEIDAEDGSTTLVQVGPAEPMLPGDLILDERPQAR